MRNILLITAIASSLLACVTPVKQQVKQSIEIGDLEVNEELWRSVPNFNNSTSNDKHYVIRMEEDATTVIKFGDGKHGARLPAETKQIKVRYRAGGGYTGVRNQQGRVRVDGDRNCK